MKKFELYTGILALIAILFQFIHFPGSGFLLSLFLLVLAVFYLIFTAILLNKLRLSKDAKTEIKLKSNTWRIIGTIILGFALSIIVIGVLFKLQIWAGAAFQLYTGLVSLALILPVALFRFLKSKDAFYIRIFKRIFIIGGIGLITYFIPTGMLIDFYYRDYPEYASVYKQWLDDQENPELEEQLRQMKKEMDY